MLRVARTIADLAGRDRVTARRRRRSAGDSGLSRRAPARTPDDRGWDRHSRGVCRVPAPELVTRAASRTSRLLRARSRSPAERARAARPRAAGGARRPAPARARSDLAGMASGHARTAGGSGDGLSPQPSLPRAAARGRRAAWAVRRGRRREARGARGGLGRGGPRRDAGERLRRGDDRAPRARARCERGDGGRAARRRRRCLRPPCGAGPRGRRDRGAGRRCRLRGRADTLS